MNLDNIAQKLKLNEVQKSNLQLILTECESYSLSKEQTAYVIATSWHECKLIPCEEIGKGKGKPYGKKIKYNRSTYTTPDKIYFGRGFVQLTWYELYERFGKLLNIDLLNNPELAMQPLISAEILVLGMCKGMFTGAKLSTFINDSRTDFIGARRIINGKDKAELIASYAKSIL